MKYFSKANLIKLIQILVILGVLISIGFIKTNDNSSPAVNNFPPSQLSIDGFYLGQSINAVKNVLGEPDQPYQVINVRDGEDVYIYSLDSENSFMAFSVPDPQRGVVGSIQITGDVSDKETFLGLKLGDSKEKVIATLGQPSEIGLGTRSSSRYEYEGRNYSVQISDHDKLMSIRLDALEGFPREVDENVFLEYFKSSLNTNDINEISGFLMPDVEIFIGNEVYRIDERFLDSLTKPDSEITNQLLFAENNVKDVLNSYNGIIDLQNRFTQYGPSGYVYKFPDSKVLEEIFVVLFDGKLRVYEIRYRDSTIR